MVMRARGITLTLLVALVLSLSVVPPARAAVIFVDEVICTLVEAINSANSNGNVGGCVGIGAYNTFSASDTIELNADVVLTTTDNNFNGNSGTPVVFELLIINGNGHTIRRDPSLACPEANPSLNFRILTNASSLTLDFVIVQGGCVENNPGGGIFTGSFAFA